MSSFEERRPASWRLWLIIFALRSLGGVCRSTGGATDSPFARSLPASTLQRKVLGQEIGSPSELAWQAWLLVENKHAGHNSGLDSSNILRRITPKSIFIAPELLCPSGSSSDNKGGCKPDPIKVDEDAQRQFWLKRLNALYGKQNANKTKKPGEAGTGPLQINIPISALGSPVKPPATANDSNVTERPLATEIPVSSLAPSLPDETSPSDPLPVDREAIPVVVSQQSFSHGNDSGNSSQDAVAVVIYELQSNDTTREPGGGQPGHKDTTGPPETESHSSHEPSTTDKYVIPHEGLVAVPVAEVGDESNEALAVGVINYKIQNESESTLNRSSGLADGHVDNGTRPGSVESLDYHSDRSDEASPTVVLLTSPTKPPPVASSKVISNPAEVVPADQPQVEPKSEEKESTTIQMIESETRLDVDPSIQTVVPLEIRSPPITNAPTVSKIPDDEDLETTYADERNPAGLHSAVDHGDYGETTYQEDLDDFVEGEDELLRAGEASMMVTAQHNFDRLKSHDRTPSTLSNLEDLAGTTLMEISTEPALPTAGLQNAEGTTDNFFKVDLNDYTKDDLRGLQTTEVPSTIITTDAGDAAETTVPPTQPIRLDIWPENTPTVTSVNNSAIGASQQPVTAEPATTVSGARFETRGTVVAENDLVTIVEPQLNLSTQSDRDLTSTLESRGRITQAPKTIKMPFASEAFSDLTLQSDLPPFAEIRRISPDEFARGKLPLNVKSEPYFFKNDAIGDIDNDDDVADENDNDRHSLPSEFRDQMQFDSRRPSSSSGANNDESAAASMSSPRFAELVRPQQLGYARYPSDEVNSIHNLDGFKDGSRSPYRSREPFVSVAGASSPSASTKSSVAAGRLKSAGPSQWRLPAGFGALPPQQQQRHEQRQQKQKPMLLRFWARMPLVRDLSFYPGTSQGSHNEPIGGGWSQSTPSTASAARRQQHDGQYKDALPYDPVNRLPSVG